MISAVCLIIPKCSYLRSCSLTSKALWLQHWEIDGGISGYTVPDRTIGDVLPNHQSFPCCYWHGGGDSWPLHWLVMTMNATTLISQLWRLKALVAPLKWLGMKPSLNVVLIISLKLQMWRTNLAWLLNFDPGMSVNYDRLVTDIPGSLMSAMEVIAVTLLLMVRQQQLLNQQAQD